MRCVARIGNVSAVTLPPCRRCTTHWRVAVAFVTRSKNVSISSNARTTAGALTASGQAMTGSPVKSATRVFNTWNTTAVAREASPSEVARWDEIATRFDGCGLAHKMAWIRSLEGSGLGRPLFLLFERDREIVGCLPGLLVRVGPLRIFGSPLPGWQSAGMGPLFDAGRVSPSELTGTLIRFLERHHGVHHIELVSPSLDHTAMRAARFKGETVPTFRCRLFADEAAQRKALKESARRNIRRGIKLGLEVRFEEDERFVDEHFDQVCEVFTRGGNSVPFRKRRVLEYFRHLRASGNLLAAAVYLPTGECIATSTFAVEGKELVLWNWTHRTSYRWYRPTELMTWTVMRRAAAMGCTTFDMMGRGDFKTRFGAELDETRYRWVRSRYQWIGRLRDLASHAYRVQQAARGRLARARLNLLARLARREGTSAGATAEAGSNGADGGEP